MPATAVRTNDKGVSCEGLLPRLGQGLLRLILSED